MLADRIIFVCVIVLTGVYFYATAQIPSLEIGDPLGPKVFPRLLGAGLLIAAVMLLLEMRRGSPRPETDDDGSRRHYLVIAAVVVWTFLYFISFQRLGFVPGTAVYLFVLMAYFHRRRWRTNVLTSVLFALSSYVLFTRLLDVNLPRGIMPF